MKMFAPLFFCIFFHLATFGQKTATDEISELKRTISFLSDDRLEGRRTGTPGEKLAYEFLITEFKKARLEPPGKYANFLQEFQVKDGRVIDKATKLSIAGATKRLHIDFFPLAYSGNVQSLAAELPTLQYGYFNLDSVLKLHAGSPHFDLNETLYSEAKRVNAAGKSAFIIYGTDTNYISFNPHDGNAPLDIPVVYLKAAKLPAGSMDLTVSVSEVSRSGHNVIGMIDNKAASSIVIGAHYDHLGYGEDHNSLYVGAKPEIHNGADDNASGAAALILLGKWLERSRLKNFNYILVAFSGEELGLYGSKYFVENCPVEPGSISYMINMDMIGRLNDSTKSLSVGGFGTSILWSEILKPKMGDLNISIDSSGTGPSDHTSFYRRDIPVLFFFTGAHKDYHKPTDDADRINYSGEAAVLRLIRQVLTETDKRPRPKFLKTREITMGKTSLRVTLGIMPDYTFSGAGVRVDGVIDNRPAKMAGVKTGDVILKLGTHSVTDVQQYMKVLNMFNKGEETKLRLRRGDEDVELDLVF